MDAPTISKSNRSVSIQESRAYFDQNIRSINTRSLINQNDWQGLELAWVAAKEVDLADSSIVVIVPVADSAIMVNPYLDAYFIFYEDSSSVISINALVFQSDTSAYPAGILPSLTNFSGLIWEFDFRRDTIGVFKAENGWVVDCGCSNTFMEYAQDVNSGAIQVRWDEPSCFDKGWLGEIWEGIGGIFVGFGEFVDGVWDGISEFFSPKSNVYTWYNNTNAVGFNSSGTGAGSFGFGNGSWGHGGGQGGGTSGGGGSSSYNLADYFSEWEIKQMGYVAQWMNDTYGTNWNTHELIAAMGTNCIWEISEYIQASASGPVIGDENEGPLCMREHLTLWILGMFPQLTENDEVEIYYLLHHPSDREKLASYTNGDVERTDNMKEFIHLKSTHSPYKVERFIEIWGLLDANPNALVVNCILQNSEYDFDFWSSLASFYPPQIVRDRISALGEGWILQSFATPTLAPHINLDYFSINISLMPFKNEQTGERWLPEDFLEYIRKNINSFVDTEASDFNPYRYPIDNYDFNLWNSSEPLTSVLSIEIPGDDGSVICSKSEDEYWIFSTLKAPLLPLSEDGFHPVSGNRQFGFVLNPNQSVTLYTKGADRVFFPPAVTTGNSIVPYLAQQAAFSGADALWNSFQTKTSAYIIAHGGVATIIPSTKNRPKVKDALRQLLSSNTPITTQNICGN